MELCRKQSDTTTPLRVLASVQLMLGNVKVKRVEAGRGEHDTHDWGMEGEKGAGATSTGAGASAGTHSGCECGSKRVTGVLDDCLCDVDSIDNFNTFKIFPKIKKLQERDYFRYYKETSSRTQFAEEAFPFLTLQGWNSASHYLFGPFVCDVEPPHPRAWGGEGARGTCLSAQSKVPVGIKAGGANKVSRSSSVNASALHGGTCPSPPDAARWGRTRFAAARGAPRLWRAVRRRVSSRLSCPAALEALEFRFQNPWKGRGELRGPSPRPRVPAGVGCPSSYLKVANATRELEDCEQASKLGAVNSTLSNQSKEAFIDWARYDDSQDHFCELDVALIESLCSRPFAERLRYMTSGLDSYPDNRHCYVFGGGKEFEVQARRVRNSRSPPELVKHLVVTLLSKDSLKIHLQRCAVNQVCDGGGYREPLPECDERSPAAQYVDLLLNPERYTGYKGPSAWRVWNSIYEENCFK
ncbi:hypothetical protein CB1_018138001 [Camelus ferus]|nr:hypothetical protein CB1_018138001 [Camelus ferus]